MTQLTFIQGGADRARRVWRTASADQASAPIVVLNGHAHGGGLKDPEGGFSIKWLPRGRVVYRTDGASHRVGSARALILNSGQPYELEFAEGQASETLCIFFQDQLVDDGWACLSDPTEALGRGPERAPAFPELVFAPGHTLGERLAALRARFDDEDPLEALDEGELIGLLASVLAAAGRHRLACERVPAIKASTRNALLSKLQRACDLIDDDPCAPPSLDALSTEVALSKFYLVRLFAAVLGCAPGAYASARRVERARRLLASSDRSLEAVAEDLGYGTATSLSRAFRRHTGQTPGVYRREIRNLG
jgi:AraC-like DNA-binding protein